MMVLQRSFYSRNSATVAHELLGKKICRVEKETSLGGIISETEAYFDQRDSASHAAMGQTPRNAVMFGPAGHAYVYFVYGLHNMFNIVTETEGKAGAVLIRAIFPINGRDEMIRARLGHKDHIADGPARLCQALRIDRSLNRVDLTGGQHLWLETALNISPDKISSGPRIGINYADIKDREAPLRFWISQEYMREINFD